MITSQFPTLARVAIIDNDNGYFIKKKSGEILDIRFNTAMEAIDYARANRLIVIIEDDEGEIDQ